MKKNFSLLLLLSTFLTFAQTGNVGIGTTLPASKLTVNGSFAGAYNHITANAYTVSENDFSIIWEGTANGTINLVNSTTGSDRVGRLYYFKNNSTAYSLSIVANGSEKIDNASSVIIQPGESVLLVKTNLNTASTSTYCVLLQTQTQQTYMYTISSTTNQNVNEGILATLSLSTVDYSTNGGGDFNATTSTWTCPQSGWYDIQAIAQASANTANSHSSLIIRKNGTAVANFIFYVPIGSLFNTGSTRSVTNLNKGDQITIATRPCSGCGSTFTSYTNRKIDIKKL